MGGASGHYDRKAVGKRMMQRNNGTKLLGAKAEHEQEIERQIN